MGTEWQDVALGKHADLRAGFAFKSSQYDEKPVGPRLLLGANVAPNHPDWSKLRFWPASQIEGAEEYLLDADDVILAMDRPWIPAGLKLFRLSKADLPCLLVQRVARLKGSPTLDIGFLYFALRHPRFTSYILAVQTGSTVPHISAKQINDYPLQLPPLPEQRRIAGVLGALDDKIELNRKMNRTLEEMAQALFKSWFIDFDGVDDLVDSELGPIPKGWEVVPVPEILDFNPKTTLKKGTLAKFVDMKALSTSGCSVLDVGEKVLAGGGTKFMQGDTLLARITPCLENGKTALVDFLSEDEAAFGSTEFIVMRPKGATSPEWAYCLARSDEFRQHAISNMTGSSGRQRVPVDCFEHFSMPRPDPQRLLEFRTVAQPQFERIRRNALESRTLTQLRDTLLPKLISGEIRVPEAEEAVEAAL